MAQLAFNHWRISENSPRNASASGDDRKCVLLIEDNEEAMFLVRCAMEEYGRSVFRLEWAATLNDGLEKLRKGGIDVVLLDLGLPESSGAESYSRLREVSQDVPVLVLTGDTREQTELAIASTDVEDYLVKDQISGSLLMQAIRTALRKAKRTLKAETQVEGKSAQASSAVESSAQDTSGDKRQRGVVVPITPFTPLHIN